MGFYLRLVDFGTSSSYYSVCMTEDTWDSKVFHLDRHVGLLTPELVAGEEGFEPPNGSSRGYCLTAWRLPNSCNEKIWTMMTAAKGPSPDLSPEAKRRRVEAPLCGA